EHGDVGGAAADIYDHRSARFRNRKVGAECGRDRLLDDVDAARAGDEGRVIDGAALARRGAVGNADHNARTAKAPTPLGSADEMLDHFLRGGKVGNDAVTHRLDDFNRIRRAAEHRLRFLANSDDLAAVFALGNGNDRRLVNNNAPARHIDERIRRAEVDGHVRGDKAHYARKHSAAPNWLALEEPLNAAAGRVMLRQNFVLGNGWLLKNA